MGATYVTIQGNLTEDPSFNTYPPSETQLARFRLAASRRFKTERKAPNGDQVWDDTDHLYIDVKCWGKLANNCRMSLRRGHPVTVTGKLVTESWQETIYDKEGKETTAMRSKIVIIASQVAFNLSNFQVNSVKTETMTHTLPGSEEMQAHDAATFDFEAQRREEEEREPLMAGAPSFADDATQGDGGEEANASVPF
ncbi:single-stranded DNA-binding protein [Corynebacterium sp. TA-R-1]|uniref:Single-stranded DNA-binding protein n=1 Tax=Corynebacterium stercoris TaxID=2943490 RepID=A0ABT1FYU8_9CORY|nr:single-stranded DNA-binding protein [Corynebacterium stercoris]MCP1386926.1 single-stranded DNA-binding protein [Corynebacterium stercoris]